MSKPSLLKSPAEQYASTRPEVCLFQSCLGFAQIGQHSLVIAKALSPASIRQRDQQVRDLCRRRYPLQTASVIKPKFFERIGLLHGEIPFAVVYAAENLPPGEPTLPGK
jgi:hypothetical protein